MFGFFKKKSKVSARNLNHFSELKSKDLVTFKDRSILPLELQGQSFTVERVQSYQYDDGVSPEFVLQHPAGNVFTVMCSDLEEGETLTIAKKLPHEIVDALFSMPELESIFSDDVSTTLAVQQENIPKDFEGWLPERYMRTIYNAVGFFYKDDRRSQGVSDYVGDGSEELRYHECTGTPDHFSLNIEIWEDGSTDIFVQITVPQNVISEMWPNEQQD